MMQELFAYVIRDSGYVSDMPTDELLVALDKVMQGSTARGQSMFSDTEAVYEFLQGLKRAMRRSKQPVVAHRKSLQASGRTSREDEPKRFFPKLKHHAPAVHDVSI